MTVYDYADYRLFFKAYVAAKKKAGMPMTYASLAERARVQKSYLSRVMSGAARVNGDQLYALGQACDLSEDEIDYLLLLLEIESTTLRGRRALLERRRERLRASGKRAQKVTKASPDEEAESLSDYYADPLCALVHMFLTVPEYRKDVGRLAERLSVTPARVGRAITSLRRLGIIAMSGRGIEVRRPLIRADRESPLAGLHGALFRLRAMERQVQRTDPRDYFTSISFSGTESLREELREKFLKFLKSSAPEIEASPAKEVFHLNFDLFRV